METAELKEFYPLADCQLDMAEDYLHPATGSVSQETGSSGTPVMGNLPDQNTGNRDIQETGSLESPPADKSEAAIVASSAERAPVHAAIYPNSGSISPFIITGNKSGEQLPVLNLDAMGESGRLERGNYETTITTDVAGAELMTRTGHEYNQIPRTHAETECEQSEETSLKCVNTVAPNETAEPEKDDGDEDLETDLRESRAFDDVIVEQEVSEQDGVATDAPLPDVRLDQPTSSQKICYEETKLTELSPQEVLVETTDLRPEEHAIGTETLNSTNVHNPEEPTIREGEMQFNDVPESDISIDEDWPILSSATIDCPASTEPTTVGEVPPASPNERQRPVRIANRPTRYRDSSFETRFQPVPRRRCKKIQRPSLTGHNAQNTEVHHELGRGADHQNITSTGNENARQKPPFCLKDSYPDPSDDLLATSRSLNNKRRRFLRKDRRQMKFTTLLYPPMNIRNKESSIETSTTRQERLRAAHLQLESTDRVRASNGRWVAVPRKRGRRGSH